MSVFHPNLLRDVQKNTVKVRVNGLGGKQLELTDEGYLPEFFAVYASEHTAVNILSLADVEALCPITYTPCTSFTVHLPERDIVFTKRGKHYVADTTDVVQVYTTAKENEQLYTKSELKTAKEAYEFLRNSGYPSQEEAIHLIQDGNIFGLPHLTREDVQRAYDIYGVPPEYVRGKMTARTTKHMPVDPTAVMQEKLQVLYTDVMHIDGHKFLVSVVEPLQLTIQAHLQNETATQLGLGIQGHLGILRARGFQPTTIFTDPQAGFRTLVGQFPGVNLDIGGAKDFVSKVDQKIRRIKELYRSVKAGLPWTLPSRLVPALVNYTISRLNLRRTSALPGHMCPLYLFTGAKINFRKQLTLAFGDYCKFYDGTDNTSKGRTLPCIALHPCNNATGSWEFLNLKTNLRIRRSNWKKMVMTDLIISIINNVAGQGQIHPEPLQPVGAIRQPTPPVAAEEKESTEENEDDAVPPLVPQEEDDMSDDEAEDDEQESDEEEGQIEEPAQPTRRRARIAQGVKPPERYALVTKIQQATTQLENKRPDEKTLEAAKWKAIEAEILQIFVELKVLLPVMHEDIPEDAEILCSFIFLVEKFLANGDFDKVKGRMVANGAQQSRELYPNRSSPTVGIHSMMTCLVLAVQLSDCVISKVDVKGAYLQMEMTGSPAFMKLDKKLTESVIALLPELKRFVTKQGTMYTRLLKALYGCVQSSRLWYEKLVGVLRSLGYETCPVDPCVMRRIVNNRIHLIIIYVDVLLLLTDKAEAARLEKELTSAFKWITMTKGNTHSYLGMQILLRNHSITIDMSFFVKSTITELQRRLGLQHLKQRAVPGNKTYFVINHNATKLCEEHRKIFHTTTACLLYLAKRARPDILTVTSFLCTRVKSPTEEDMTKLLLTLGYLQNTQQTTLTLKPKKPMQLEVYIDAAFAAHDDSKSHSGIAVFVAGVVVYASSRKQKCITRSPTESELVALTDNISLIELFHEFLEFVTAGAINKPIIFQDCTAVIQLVTTGGRIPRTKHLRARMNAAREAIQQDRIQVVHCRAALMRADGLTKPLEGADFTIFTKHMLCKA